MTTTQNPAMQNALAFAARGYPVLPLYWAEGGNCACGNKDCTSPGKHPHGRLAPNGLKNATADRAAVREWFSAFPNLSYGVCTDTLPTVDIDPRNGGDQAWLKLVRKNHDVHSWRVSTGGGGVHIIFKGDGDVANGKLARGVDVKGAGGYIVGPGSIHASGKRYTWFKDANPGNTELAAPPAWLREVLAAPTSGKVTPRDAAFYDALVAPAFEGERNERVAALCGHLFGTAFPDRGVLYVLVQAWNKQFVDPPLQAHEVEAVVLSIVRREDKKRGGNE